MMSQEDRTLNLLNNQVLHSRVEFLIIMFLLFHFAH